MLDGLVASAALFVANPLAPAKASQASPVTAFTRALGAVQAAEQRVATIGYRLAVANRARCPDRQFQVGLVLHSLSQYVPARRAEVTRFFGLDRGTAIMAVVEDAPAGRSGLRADDRLVRIDGEAVAETLAAGADFSSVEAWRELLRRSLADGEALVDVTRGGAARQVRLIGTSACPADFQLDLSNAFAAAADGRRIRVSTAILAFVADDDELASVLAHELAHNILRHRARLDASGVNRGLARELGIGAGRIRETELEADRLSITLMAAAGYDPQAAVRYMERAIRRPGYREGPTHPRGAERIAVLRAAIAALGRVDLRSSGTSAPRPPARAP